MHGRSLGFIFRVPRCASAEGTPSTAPRTFPGRCEQACRLELGSLQALSIREFGERVHSKLSGVSLD